MSKLEESGFDEVSRLGITGIDCGAQVPTTLIYSKNVVPGSYVGLAGLSIPVGLTVRGLPVGLELDNVEGSDETVLGVGLSIGHVSGSLPAPVIH
jgi:mandelamide amidase